MTDDQWQGELEEALKDLEWRVFSAACAQDSSTCFADLLRDADGASKRVRLSPEAFPTVESRKAEILRQANR
jgi:hypothetical protein